MSVAIEINFRKQLLEKQRRENRHITYTDIENETGTPLKTVSRWDKGKVTQIHTDVLERFCKYFNCNVEDLVRYLPNGNA